MGMKKYTMIFFLVSMLTMVMVLTGCGDKRYEGNLVELGELSVELPESKWTYDEEITSDKYIKLISDDYGIVEVREGDDGEFESDTLAFDSRVRFIEDFAYESPEHYETYINGYRTQFGISEKRTYAIIKYDDNIYYFVSYIAMSSCENPEEIGLEIVKMISVNSEAEGKYWSNIYDCDAANEIKEEMIIDGIKEMDASCTIMGKVMCVDTNDGATYIDIGAAYPNSNRITGVIWPEYRQNFSDDPESYLGKTVYLVGEPYIYDGVLNIKIEFDRQVIEVVELDTL